MIKKIIMAGSFLLLSMLGKAQQKRQDSIVSKSSRLQSEIDLVYNHYEQDGNHSAVTGGQGTERLSVYGPSLSLTQHFYHKKTPHKEIGSLYITGGTDIITSASVDNIDFVTSASRLDLRNHIDASYTFQLGEHSLSIGGGQSFESDYWSYNGMVGYAHQSEDGLRDFSVSLKVYDDDLRWGRLYPDYRRPVLLVYPYELRDSVTVWHDVYKRNSFNLKGNYSFFANVKNSFAVMVDATYQKGLLSTPFHRVYKSGRDTAVVENLPQARLKTAIGLHWHTFVAGRWVFKNALDLYRDTWDIYSLSLSHEAVFKANQRLAFMPNMRLYTQSGTPYFYPYQEVRDQQYFTSDYDYSRFGSLNVGVGIRYQPIWSILGIGYLDQLTISYNHYRRSDGLKAHMATIALNVRLYKTIFE